MKKAIPIVLGLLFVVGLVYMLSLGGAQALDKGVLVYGRGSDSKSLDPADIDDGESVKVVVNVYEPLVQIKYHESGRMVVVPLLAEKWEPLGPDADGKARHGFKFTLRAGVKFHDGTPLDADAVVYSLKRLVAGKAADGASPDARESPYRSYYTSIVGDQVKKVGDLEVEVPTKEPDAQLLINLAMFPACIVSPTAAQQAGAEFGQKVVVGTGPFIFDKWERNKRIVLKANPEYWDGEPAVKQLHFVEVRDNNSRLQNLKNGDVLYTDNINPQDIPVIQEDPNLTVMMRPTGREISLLYMSMNTTAKPFDNVKFRQAIALAIDKQKIAGLYYGIATPAELAVPPGIQGYNDMKELTPRDVEKAKQLLAESGVTQKQFTLVHMANPRPYIRQPKEVARAIKDSLAEIGLEITTEAMPWKAYLAKVQNGEHQLALLGWTTDNGDADNFLSTFYSEATAKKGSALNISFFTDSKMELLLQQQKRIVDQAARQKVLNEIYAYAKQQTPLVPLVYCKDMIAFNKAVTNVSLHPLGKHLFGKVGLAQQK